MEANLINFINSLPCCVITAALNKLLRRKHSTAANSVINTFKKTKKTGFRLIEATSRNLPMAALAKRAFNTLGNVHILKDNLVTRAKRLVCWLHGQPENTGGIKQRARQR